MTRIGAEADPQLTQEFLLNLPKEDSAPDGILAITFMSLTPDQQVDALIQLEAIYRESFKEMDAIDLAINLKEPTLALVMQAAIPDVMKRVTFWGKFLEECKGGGGPAQYHTFSDQGRK